ncbi:hypothetical protein P691DRAFT_683905, partial [Macrolepiota fuliginosa MF-IS2]
LKKCNGMMSFDRVVECQAVTGPAELGLQIGLQSPGIQDEIQKAITKALPSLHLYRHRLTQLPSQLSLASGNPKAAQNNLKHALATFTQNDPPHILYTSHLALIASISSQSSDETTNTIHSLGTISDLHNLAPNEIGESLEAAEGMLDMEDILNGYAQEKGKVPEDQKPMTLPLPPSSSGYMLSMLEYTLIVHTLILGIIFHTYIGDASLRNLQLKWLHKLLDIQLPC